MIRFSVAALISLSTIFGFTSRATASEASLNNEVASQLSVCLGELQASAEYSGVEGIQQAARRAAAALNNILLVAEVSDPAVYLQTVKSSKDAYYAEMFRDPMNTRNNIKTLMESCSTYARAASEIRNDRDQRLVAAKAALVADQNARRQEETLRADKEKAQADADRIRAQAEADVQLRADQARTAEQNRKIEIAAAADAKDKDFARSKELAQLEKQKAELNLKVAEAEKEKAQALAQAEKSKLDTAEMVLKSKETDSNVAKSGASSESEGASTGTEATTDAPALTHGDGSAHSTDKPNITVQQPRAIDNTKNPFTGERLKNQLEAALTPMIGTKEMYDEIQDEGLDSLYFYGFSFSGGALTWSPSGKISTFVFRVSTTVPPKDLRAKLDAICGFKPSDWKITNNTNYRAGNAERKGCALDYMPFDENSWAVSFSDNATNS